MATSPTEPKKGSSQKPRLDPYTWAKLDEEAEFLREALEMLRFDPDQSPSWQYEKGTELRGLLFENDQKRKHLRGLAFEAHEKKRAADPTMATQPIDHKKGSVQKPRLDPYTWAKLDEEEERLRDALEMLRFDPDQSPSWQYEKGTELRGLLEENERQRKHLRGLAFEVEEKKRAAEAEKKRQAEKAAAEKKRAAEKAAAERKHKEELLKQKEEEKKALQAKLAAEQKRKAEAEAAVKRYKEERAAAEEKKRQELIKKADEELESLKAELAEKKRHADLLAGYERERAVVETRKKLEDAKRRLKLEYDEWQNKSYEAWEALDRERQRELEEAQRRAARKEKEVSGARKEAERRASLVQKPKEVSFDSSRNQTYDHRSSQNYQRPEQQNFKRPDNGGQEKSHQYPPGHSRPYNYQHTSHPQNAPRPQDSQPKQYSSTHHQPRHQLQNSHAPLGASPRADQTPVGLSGLPVGLSDLPAESSNVSQSPVAVAPWEEKNWSSHGYPVSYGQPEYSHRDVSHQKPSVAEKKWSTPVIPTWNGPAEESNVMDKKRSESPFVPVSRLESPPKERWSLPPSPSPSPNERKAWNHSTYRSPEADVSTPRETEEEKLRREVEKYKVKAAKLEADLERKKRVTGADSVATWQTGTKSIWEDPTKDASKKDPRSHRNETPKPQAAKPPSSRHNEQESKRDSTATNSTQGPSKPAVSVQNLRRRQPSVSHHHSSRSKTEAQCQEPNANRNNERPESRTSTHTRYFEAPEYISSDEEQTPRPKISKPDTHYRWQRASVESTRPYVPPTPHRRPSPPPVLPPTPPRGSRVSTPATLRPASKQQASFKQEIQTPKLTCIPGSWRDELPGKDSREDRWPANVSTPSIQSPAIPVVKTKEKFHPERYIPPNYGPKDVPPPDSYLSADSVRQQAGYNHPGAPGYTPIYKPAAVPQPGPAYPIHHPLYASYSQVYAGGAHQFPPKVDVEAGPSGHGGSFPSWADPSAAQSLGGTQAPPRKDKGKGKARW
ncbi:hypothetical protein B0H65DRAFT_269767 [Neurospora tetraspora]|uniref:Uncharacterized protein n=1 Tax=Neurospora tetraspora TaxID=94610 RepID=A0AAE0JBB3_9PEZI|nr:hypothetical protein B0H65DRAFT_269767 [Neurospora tetraspora]